MTVRIGRNGGENLGAFDVAAADWRIHPRYPKSYSARTAAVDALDLAVLHVGTPSPNGYVFTLANYSPSPDTPVAVCGYASGGGRVDVNKQNIDVGRIIDLRSDFESMKVEVLALSGSSGGPAFLEEPIMSGDHEPASIPVIGILVSGPTDLDNNICLLTPDKQNWAMSA